MTTQIVRRIIFGSILVVAMLALMLFGEWESVSAVPALQTTPTPRTPGWKNRQSARLPKGLHRTAQVSVGGGGEWSPSDLCADFFVLPDSTAWAFTPGYQVVIDPILPILSGLPPVILQAQQCGDNLDLNATATIRTPGGQIIPVPFWYNGSFGVPLPGLFGYDLPLESEAGSYIMTIKTRGRTISHTFSVVEGPNNWIRFADVGTGKMRKTFAAGDVIQVSYMGLYNGYKDFVEVGLYRDMPSDGDFTLIDMWQIPEGNVIPDYQEILSIPSDAPAGSYLLMACIYECQPKFTGLDLQQIIVYNWFEIRHRLVPGHWNFDNMR